MIKIEDSNKKDVQSTVNSSKPDVSLTVADSNSF